MSVDNLLGISDYLAEKLSDDIGADRLIPLDRVGEFAFVDTEGCAVYLITIQNARLVPVGEAQDQDGS